LQRNISPNYFCCSFSTLLIYKSTPVCSRCTLRQSNLHLHTTAHFQVNGNNFGFQFRNSTIRSISLQSRGNLLQTSTADHQDQGWRTDNTVRLVQLSQYVSPLINHSGWEFVVLCSHQRSTCRVGFALSHFRNHPRMAMHVSQQFSKPSTIG
jgi:hypothetical protein